MATSRKKTTTRKKAATRSKKRGARKRSGADGEPTIEISVAQYRSLILEKIRAEIAAKRARYEQLEVADLDELIETGYWKAGYWKAKYWKAAYWKSGEVENPADEVINPSLKR